jgi:hypothetical protein
MEGGTKPDLIEQEIGIRLLWANYRCRIAFTWILVLGESAAIALIPLFIGKAIDRLLDGGGIAAVTPLASVLILLTFFSVFRRAFDTRAYGTMRVFLGRCVVERNGDQPVSKLNARLDMAREFGDFLEEHVPQLMTASVQLLVSFSILLSFDIALGASAGCLLVLIAIIYACFHPAIFRANRDLNEQREDQVNVLEQRAIPRVIDHLAFLRRFEVRMSDIDAALYGIVFLFMSAFILVNLVLAARIDAITAGTIFAVVTYSWEFVESGFALPVTLQQWTRLEEIRTRLNKTAEADS